MQAKQKRSVGWYGLWMLVIGALLATSTVLAGQAHAQDDEPAPPPGIPGVGELPDEPTIFPTVEPNSGLLDGQDVQITATDLPPGAQVIVVQCDANAERQEDCDLAFSQLSIVSSGGTVSINFQVARQITIHNEPFDCAPDACILGIAVLDADNPFLPVETGGAEINFDDSVPLPPPPSVKVRKNKDLRDGQTVWVNGSNWSTDALQTSLQQCYSFVGERGEGPGQACRYDQGGFVTVDGKINFKTTLHRTHFIGDRRLDCADDAITCELTVITFGRRQQQATTELFFSDADPLPPRPKVNLSPRKNLVDGQTINVRLVNATFGDEWALEQCATHSAEDGGEDQLGQCVHVSFDSRADVAEVRVSRSMLSFGQVVDCASAANRCVIRATNYESNLSIQRGLVFAETDEPVLQPGVTYSDLGSLTDGADVRAEVIGPFTELMLSQCPAATEDFFQCQQIGFFYGGEFGEDGGGTGDGSPDDPIIIEGQVRRSVFLDGEGIDCAAAPGTCTVMAWSYQFGLIGERELLTFVDEGPVVVPTVSMKNTGLAQQENVEVTFTDAPVGQYVQVMQCVTAEEYQCRYLNGVQINEPDFSFNVSVQRMLNANGVVADCGIEPNFCEMRFAFGDQRGGELRVGLTFDPDAPPPPPPTVTVSPRSGLTHLQPVEVTIEGVFGYFSVAQCPNEVTVIDSGDCAFLPWDEWELDEETGTSTVSVQVRRVIATSTLGRVDCAETPRRCNLVLGGESLGDSLSTRWIRFDASEEPPPPPSLIATPTSGLVDGQEIEIEAISDSRYLSVLQCAGEISPNQYPSRCRTVANVEAGSLDGPFVAGVARTILGNDCARIDCFLVLVNGETGQADAQLPLSFDPDANKAAGFSIAVSPRRDLADRQPVEVTLTGLVSWYHLQQCVVVDGEATYQCVELPTGFDPVRRTVATVTANVSRNIGEHDCAAVSLSCAIVVQYSNDAQFNDVSKKQKLLNFDPDAAPLPGPSVTVTPDSGLADGDLVVVDGSGFNPQTQVFVGVCSSDFDPDGSDFFEGACAIDPSGFAEVGADGNVSVEIAVTTEYESGGGMLNCLTTGCVVLVTDGHDFVTAQISFDPDAPASEQQVLSGLSWPDSLLDGTPPPINGFSLTPRFDLSAG